MAHKIKLIILLSFTLLSILGTTSFALTDLNDMNEETMQNIIDYCIERQSNETYLEILENVDLGILTEFWNETLAPAMINAEPIEALEQLLITYESENNKILIYYTNNTIGNSLRHATVEYVTGSGYNQYVIKNNGESYFSITINSINSFKHSVNYAGWLKLGNDISINSENSTISFPTIRSLGTPASVFFIPKDSTSSFTYFLTPAIDIYTTQTPIPPTPSGDTGESGDTGGGTGGDTGGGTTTPDYSEDLDNIQTGITDINNNIGETNNKLDNISGELSNINNNLTTVPDISDTTITSEDITSNLDFDFMEDPYSNFWLELTTGLSGALTNNIRTLDINWLGHIHTIDLDKIGLKYPPSMELILKSTSTVAIVWVLVKWWKIIVDKLSSGNMDEVLAMNEEERNY